MSIEDRDHSIIYLKLDNILLGFEHPSVIENFVRKQAENPMPQKIKDERSICLSHNDFGPPQSFGILPKIADFGLAQSGEGSEPPMHPIQPPLFHAPEVLLGTSWMYSADIWNLEVLVYFHFYHLSRVLLTRRYADLEHDGGQGFIYTYSFWPRRLRCSSTPCGDDCITRRPTKNTY